MFESKCLNIPGYFSFDVFPSWAPPRTPVFLPPPSPSSSFLCFCTIVLVLGHYHLLHNTITTPSTISNILLSQSSSSFVRMHTLVDCYVSRQSLSKFKIGSPLISSQHHSNVICTVHTLMSLLLPSFTSVSFQRQFLLFSCSHHFAPGNRARCRIAKRQNCDKSLCDTPTTELYRRSTLHWWW